MKPLTVVRHAHRETLVEPAVLALVAILLLDFAVVFALVVLQLETDGSPEETLSGQKRCVTTSRFTQTPPAKKNKQKTNRKDQTVE